MGMFDYVKVGVPLPDDYAADGDNLQSKDFDCVMTTIEITPEGRLRIEDFEYETVPKAERPYPDAPEDSLRSMQGMWRKVNRRWRDLSYHGIFNFYGGGFEGDWHEFNAKFTDGQLVSIERIEEDGPTPHPH